MDFWGNAEMEMLATSQKKKRQCKLDLINVLPTRMKMIDPTLQHLGFYQDKPHS